MLLLLSHFRIIDDDNESSNTNDGSDDEVLDLLG
jgi:hypothetical protein